MEQKSNNFSCSKYTFIEQLISFDFAQLLTSNRISLFNRPMIANKNIKIIINTRLLRRLYIVCSNVFATVTRTRECFITNITFKWLFTAMIAHMNTITI